MTGPDVREATWSAPASRRTLSYRLWQPPQSRALVVIVHGFGEHGGRHHRLARALSEAGLCVAAPDLWGHGRSSGARGDIPDIGRCTEALRELTEQVLLPLAAARSYAVFGHSFGGLVAIRWALGGAPQLRRLIVQSPLLEVGFRLPMLKRLAADLLSRCWPAAPLPMNLNAAWLSHDPAVGEAYRVDPLVHNIMTVRTYQAILRTRDEAVAQAATMRQPVLLLCGAQDRIISVEAALRWFERLGCEKRRVVFPDCYHELHHEAALPEVARLVREWVESYG